MKQDFKVFKSDEGRRKVLSFYGRSLKSVDFSFRERYVDTAFGKTYVLEAGDPEMQAVVLIHGSCSNSAAWFGDIPALSERYHIFSVDIVGDAGNSEENRLDQNSKEFEIWLKEVLDGLGIGKAILIGNSLGAWISLKYAAAYPEKVEKLVLIAPSGIAPTSASFVVKTILYLMMGAPGRKALNKMIFGKDDIPEEVMDFTRLIGENFNPLTGALPTLPDDGMRKLIMPVLFIAGENDTFTNARKAAKRLKNIVPQAEIHIVENNSHVIYDAQQWMLPFLEK
jgi:pimeloyl-ACP methyl ester carboxylesterase